MRKLILQLQISLDGFMADTNRKTDWMIWNWGPVWTWDAELRKYYTEFTLSADSILITRKMVEDGFILHWEERAKNDSDPQFEFANHMTSIPKFVFANSFKKSSPFVEGWDNTCITPENMEEEIFRLKCLDGNNIIVYGGATFVSTLIKADLIDEFHILINPVVLGKGLSIFDDLTNKLNLNLIQSKSFKSGVILAHYAVNPMG